MATDDLGGSERWPSWWPDKAYLDSLSEEKRYEVTLRLRASIGRVRLPQPYIPLKPSPTQEAFLRIPTFEVLYGGAVGGGKLLSELTTIPTPSGWRLLGDVHPGDLVFGSDGEPRLVMAEHTEEAAGWRLTFDDGSTVEAHDDHLWLTYTAAELAALTRRDPEWRARRRASRASRATLAVGGPGAGKGHHPHPELAERNRLRPPIALPAPEGSVRTTAEIVETLHTALGRTNHAIPLAEPLHLPHRDLPIDPYLVGVWLGDGTSKSGQITTMDTGVIEAFTGHGWQVGAVTRRVGSRAAGYRIIGLTSALRRAGLLGKESIPDAYLWASEHQRLALLQGLMDTDGNVSGSSVEFVNTRHHLTEAVAHLARSLGHKVTIREGRARLNGQDRGPVWKVKFAAHLPMFRLARKRDVQKIATRRTTKFRYIISAERVEWQPMKCLRVSSPDHLFLAGESMIPTHNSVALLMAALQYIEVPGYAALLIRRTYGDLSKPGALIPLSRSWLRGTSARWRNDEHTWYFPSGATLSFGYLQHRGDEGQYKSAAYHFLGWDELTEFPEDQYLFLHSRVRRPSPSGRLEASPDGLTAADVPLRIRAASNPGGPGHDWVKDRFPITADVGEYDPLEIAFVPAKLADNPGLDAATYRRSLANLMQTERARLEEGDWTVAESGGLFNMSVLQLVDDWPASVSAIRVWDLAATEEGEGRSDPDWTVGARIERSANGLFTVVDCRRARLSPAKVLDFVKAGAALDGRQVPVYVLEEPGASGKVVTHQVARELPGYIVQGYREGADKITSARPAAAALENGTYRINRWIPILDEVRAELRRFPRGGHDDIVDVIGKGYTILADAPMMGQSSISSPAAISSSGMGYRLPDSAAGAMLRR